MLLLIATLGFRQRPRVRNSILALALGLLLLSSNRWVAMGLARTLEWRYIAAQEIPEADVIVVLGGGTDSPDYPRPIVEVSGAGDRVLYAGWLYQQGKAPKILVSGGSIQWQGARSMTPAEEMAIILGWMYVPSDDLWVQDRSFNTYEEALYNSEMLQAKGIERIILVTSAMHMPRSVALFTKQGIEVIPAPVDYKVTQSGWMDLFKPDLQMQIIGILPSESSLSLTTYTLKEYLGLLVYWLRGWI
ncbi:MAG: YdcF family protein [Anaerolineaceae bacterium]|nr:YdcF family protein [Anaerolineaceae bacterium]